MNKINNESIFIPLGYVDIRYDPYDGHKDFASIYSYDEDGHYRISSLNVDKLIEMTEQIKVIRDNYNKQLKDK